MSHPASDELPLAWRSLWAMVVGFFMILVDSTIVTVATPTIMRELGANVTSVVWVTSAYLLAYAVPLLITGRLGDRFGPKRVYLIGLVVFTLASLGCGLTTTVELLIAARVVQGLGAALMTPQTMTVITRVFPPHQRGMAMAVWGATAGLAMLIGPMLGGLLIGVLGWEWIFFINIPIGVAGYVAAKRLVPDLEQHAHRFDWLGVVLSGIGLFCVVFGLQEASTHDWGVIVGPVSVGSLLVVGACFLVAFVVWQWFNPNEPLMPLKLFGDRNFSVANLAIALVGVTSVATPYPLMIWAQQARGLSPTGQPGAPSLSDHDRRSGVGLLAAGGWAFPGHHDAGVGADCSVDLHRCGQQPGVRAVVYRRDGEPSRHLRRRRIRGLQRHPAGGFGARQCSRRNRDEYLAGGNEDQRQPDPRRHRFGHVGDVVVAHRVDFCGGRHSLFPRTPEAPATELTSKPLAPP